MRSATVFSVALVLAAKYASAFTVPSNLTDGLHIFSEDEDGVLHRQYFELVDTPEAQLSNNKLKRDYKGPAGHVSRDNNAGAQCEKVQMGVDATDLGMAQYQLGTFCQKGVKAPPQSVIVGTKGDVFAYFCNYDDTNTKTCSATDLDHDVELVWNGCNGFGGWRNHPGDWQTYGYKSARTAAGSGARFKDIC